MPIVPRLLPQLSKDIGGAILLDNNEIKEAVKAATGNDPYNVYTSDKLARADQISEILTKLAIDGEERWFLTRVLSWPRTNDRLRQLIVEASRETLAALPKLDAQVGQVQKTMRELLGEAIPDEVLDELRPKGDVVAKILKQISELLVNKIHHECLHVLHLKLIYGSILDQLGDKSQPLNLQDSPKEIHGACKQARGAVPAGADGSGAQLDWVDQLDQFAADIEKTLATGDTEAASDLLYDAQRLIRRELCRLNGRVLDVAKGSLLPELLVDLPNALQTSPSFKSFRYSIYDLKTTVLARALEHTIWQDVDNELALLADLVAVPTGKRAEFIQHWVALRPRIRWLGSLNPEAPWWKEGAESSIKIIRDEVENERANNDIRPLFETFARVLRLQFLAVDAMLKADCKSLDKIDADLRLLLRNIGHD